MISGLIIAALAVLCAALIFDRARATPQRDRFVEVYEDRGFAWTWHTKSRSNGQVTGSAAESFASRENAVRAAFKEVEDSKREVWLLEHGETRQLL